MNRTARYVAGAGAVALAVAIGGWALAHGDGRMMGPDAQTGPQMMGPYGAYGMHGMWHDQMMHGSAAQPNMMPMHMGPRGGMGRGMGIGPGWAYGVPADQTEDLDADQVRAMMERRLTWHGNPRLKVGKVETQDDDWVVVDITTVDNSLVQRLLVDRHTGHFRQAN